MCASRYPRTAFKHPGRVGDSALPGCGLYADDAGGACAATGDGDQIMRFVPCLKVVQLMEGGETPARACRQVTDGIRQRLLASGLAHNLHLEGSCSFS